MGLRRFSRTMMLFLCATALFAEEGPPSIQKVLDHSQFPLVIALLSDGTERHLKIDGVGPIRDPKYNAEVQRLMIGAWLQKDGTLMSAEFYPEFRTQELRFCTVHRFSLCVDVALLLLEHGFVKPGTMSADLREEHRTAHAELCEGIKSVPQQIETLRSKQSTLEQKMDAFASLRAVRLHASAAVPLMLEMMNDPTGSLGDQALLTLGFIGSDDASHVAKLVSELKSFPDFALRALLQFGPAEKPAQSPILDLIEANPGRRLSMETERLAGAVLLQCGSPDVATRERMKKLRADKTRSGTIRCSLLEILEPLEK